MPKYIVAFGEIMGRLAPENFLRLRQAMPGRLEFTFAGAEANVAASIACLGGRAAFVTALPQNPLGEACLAAIRATGADISHIQLRKEGRLGLYFVEAGANQRPSTVVYDREASTIALTPANAYPWSDIFSDAAWLHISGITPALSAAAAASTLAAAQAAKQLGLTVSCDLNYRKKLWQWRPDTDARALARETMATILPHVDLLIGNEEDADDVLGVKAGGSDVHTGQLEIDRYPEVAREIARRFPNIRHIATTLRESYSASHNNWGAMLHDVAANRTIFSPLSKAGAYQPYEIKAIVDRVGGGDAFAAGLIFALNTLELSSPQTALNFATAASCLAHSIKGDFNFVTRAEVEALAGGSGSGRVVR
jgi:2-dehydro-3-deoxygluconokinase